MINKKNLPPCVINVLLSGVKANALHLAFIFNILISSFDELVNKKISPARPQTANNFPSGDTSYF